MSKLSCVIISRLLTASQADMAGGHGVHGVVYICQLANSGRRPRVHGFVGVEFKVSYMAAYLHWVARIASLAFC